MMVAARRYVLAGAVAFLCALLPASGRGEVDGVAAAVVYPFGGYGPGHGGPRTRFHDAQYGGYRGHRSHREARRDWGLLGLFNFPSYFSVPETVRPWWSYYPPQPVWDGGRLLWLAPRFPTLPCSDYLPPYSPGACPP